MKGKGRHALYIKRKPAHGYAIADDTGTRPEPPASVLRRMRDMIDMDFVLRAQRRRESHKPWARRMRFNRDWKFKVIQKENRYKRKQEFQDSWLSWVQTQGRFLGLTEPVVYNGPKLGAEFAADPELKALYNNTANFKKELFFKKERLTSKEVSKLFKKGQQLPEEIKPGKWVEEGPLNIFNIYKRPLARWAVDVPWKSGKKHPGIVI